MTKEGISGAQVYADRLASPGHCYVCGFEFPVASRVALAFPGLGIIQFCGENCHDKFKEENKDYFSWLEPRLKKLQELRK